VQVSSRERTLVDALRDPSWLGGTRSLADALRQYLDFSKRSTANLVRELRRFPSGAQAKRLGWLLEAMGVLDTRAVEELLALRSAGYIRLDPAIRSRGKLSKRWGLWINADVQRR
jgi:predicted transcriptional regulator of viral defense system